MNNSGQALIEALVISFILVLGLIFILRFGFTLQQNVLVNELVEETLICHFKDQRNCLQILNEKLESFHFKQIHTSLEKHEARALLKLDAVSGFGYHFIKESELTLDLSIRK